MTEKRKPPSPPRAAPPPFAAKPLGGRRGGADGGDGSGSGSKIPPVPASSSPPCAPARGGVGGERLRESRSACGGHRSPQTRIATRGAAPPLPPLALRAKGGGELRSAEDLSLLAPPSPYRARIVAIARSWLGTPYLHQASQKGQGTDCLGLIRGVWRELYGAEPEAPPPYTPDWNERRFARGAEPLLDAARRHLVAVGAPRPGDALFFRIVATGPAKHCGILVEEDRFIHAYAGRCVLESWLSRWWRERLAGTFAFPGTGASPSLYGTPSWPNSR